jgi:hypothetical protein
VLNHEGRTLFERLCAGRVGEDRIFKKGNSTVWGKSHQHRPPKEACERAKILPSLDFHSLRHTWTSCRSWLAPLCLLSRKTWGMPTREWSSDITDISHNPLSRTRSGAPRPPLGPEMPTLTWCQSPRRGRFVVAPGLTSDKPDFCTPGAGRTTLQMALTRVAYA